jgi:hypothetical protein
MLQDNLLLRKITCKPNYWSKQLFIASILTAVKGDQRQVELIQANRKLTDEKEQKSHKIKNFPVFVAAGIIKLIPKPTAENPEATEKEMVEYSGFAQLDFDGLRALGLDPEVVRDEFAKLWFVAYSGLSVRGGGVWLLVFLDAYDMETYAKRWKACFEFCYSLLDKFLGYKAERDSKGCNPTDYRFIAPDPNGKWRYNPQPFTLILQEKPKPKPKTFTYTKNATNQEAIANHIQREIDQAPDGQKHETLRRLSFWAGGLVAGGQISFDQAHEILKTSILSRKIDSERNAEKTIESGLRKGAEKPIYPSSQPSVAYSRYDWSQKGAIAAFESENDTIRSCTQPCEHIESYITIEGEQYSLLINANGYPSDWDNVEPLPGYQQRKESFENRLVTI